MSSKYPEYEDPMAHPRYTGLATFFRAPHTESFAEADIGIVGVPFDGGTTNRPGARHGPREVRNQSSLLRPYNQANGLAPFNLCKVFDVGDAWVTEAFDLEKALGEIQSFFARLHSAGVIPLAVGGDHSITLPILRAIAKEKPLGLVHFDAHCDTGDDYLGSRFHHGAPFRRAVEEGLLDPKRCIQIGIRGATVLPKLWQFSYDAGMRVITMDELQSLGVVGVIREIGNVVGNEPAYVSFDVDGLDPAFAPGTGTPEVGGFTTWEAQTMIRGLQGLNLVGGDVVEVSPPFDPTGVTALTGAAMLFELLCVLADARFGTSG
jgi:guanidinopropionase